MTSIQVSRDTKDRLDKIGRKGDTYADIIRRLGPATSEEEIKIGVPRKGALDKEKENKGWGWGRILVFVIGLILTIVITIPWLLRSCGW